jgi:hypothetical protein
MGKNAIALSYKVHFTEVDQHQSSLQVREREHSVHLI